jgi:hypothetical protein
MKILHRIMVLVGVIAGYVIVKEFIEIYTLTSSLHPYAGYATLLLIAGFSYYFIGAPIYRILRVPVAFGPTRDPEKIEHIIDKRIERYRQNAYLKHIEFNFSGISANQAGYDRIMETLQPEVERIRERYVTQLFYSTSIAQNGFLDALLIFSASVNLIKEIFILYNGRVSNRELWVIGKKVYMSMAIGGSETIEYATGEILSKMTFEGLKSMPFADKIMGSVADGFVNSVLLTRVALITENYCKKVYIQSDRDLIPSPKLIASTAKNITADVTDTLVGVVKNLGERSWGRAKDFANYAANPMRYLYQKVIEASAQTESDEETSKIDDIKEVISKSSSSIGHGVSSLFGIFKGKTGTT